MARRPKNPPLPGLEDAVGIPELRDVALQYADARDRRMNLLEEEVELKEKLLELMHKHKKEKYTCEGIEIRIVREEETVKVKILKTKSEKEAA